MVAVEFLLQEMQLYIIWHYIVSFLKFVNILKNKLYEVPEVVWNHLLDLGQNVFTSSSTGKGIFLVQFTSQLSVFTTFR